MKPSLVHEPQRLRAPESFQPRGSFVACVMTRIQQSLMTRQADLRSNSPSAVRTRFSSASFGTLSQISESPPTGTICATGMPSRSVARPPR